VKPSRGFSFPGAAPTAGRTDYDAVWRRKGKGGLRRVSEHPCRILDRTQAGWPVIEYWSGARIVTAVHPDSVVMR
jgi:hypothetical protein